MCDCSCVVAMDTCSEHRHQAEEGGSTAGSRLRWPVSGRDALATCRWGRGRGSSKCRHVCRAGVQCRFVPWGGCSLLAQMRN